MHKFQFEESILLLINLLSPVVPCWATLWKSDVIEIAKPMNKFVFFVKNYFQLVDDFETVLLFTAVTPVEHNAVWLLAYCSSNVFFYSIMEVALSRANIVVCTNAQVGCNCHPLSLLLIDWLIFFSFLKIFSLYIFIITLENWTAPRFFSSSVLHHFLVTFIHLDFLFIPY